MALAKDEGTAAGRGRNLDDHGDGGVILYRSDFDAGFDGWTDHWDGYRPWPIVSRTSEMQYRGSHSLMLSTGEHASPASNDVSNQVAVFKRLARHEEYRYHHFSAYLALGVMTYDSSWSAFQMYIDTQNYTSTVRSFFKAQCVIHASPTFANWRVRGDNGDNTDSNWKNIPSSGRLFIGNNDNKQNMQYVRLTVDLQANSGLGGYQELQIGQGKSATVFDLTGLGAGSSLEPCQWDGSNLITDFSGGFNIGFGLSRNTDVAGGCQLFADDVVYSATNTL